MRNTTSYANTANQAVGRVVQQAKELDKLDVVVASIRQSTSRVRAFIDHFHGNDAAEPVEECDSGSYASALLALETVAERLATSTAELRTIG